jgi:hypothetical protein
MCYSGPWVGNASLLQKYVTFQYKSGNLGVVLNDCQLLKKGSATWSLLTEAFHEGCYIQACLQLFCINFLSVQVV